jgi:hypothetical protein
MQIRRVLAVVVVTLVAIGSAEGAGPSLSVVEPEPPFGLGFARIPFDSPSPPQRIRIRNLGDAARVLDIDVPPPFTIVATSGDLGAGHDMTWDITCTPTDPDGSVNFGFFVLEWCGSSCSDHDGFQFIDLNCQGGLLDTPDSQLFMPSVYAYETSRQTISFTNPGPSSITITSFASNDVAFSGALASGTLPLTLAPGESVNVVATFDTTRPDTTGLFDVVAGTAVVGRVRLFAATLGQLFPPAWSFAMVPRGAVYTAPLTVRNSFPEARTITAATFDLPAYTVTGLVGRILAPGEVASGLVTFTADALGTHFGLVTVTFDRGHGGAGRFLAEVVAPVFSVTTGDAVPGDGWLDFGTRKVGSGPVEQTFTISNLEAVDLAMPGCSYPDPGQDFQVITACPTTIPANGSVQFTVRFTPTVAGDALHSMGTHLTGIGSLQVAFRARVVPNQLAISATKLDFPDTLPAAFAQRVVTLTNLVANPIVVPVAITGAGFSVGADTVTIPGGATADIVVEFRPPAAGLFTGSLSIGATGDPDHGVIALSGLGLPPTSEEPDGDGDGCRTAGLATGSPAFAMLGVLWPRRRRRSGDQGRLPRRPASQA